MTQILFETFNTPSFYVAPSPQLALYASGRTTGIVLGCGAETITSVPIYEGYCIPNSIEALNIGGTDLTKYMESILWHEYTDKIRDMKERHGYVALNYGEEVIKYEKGCIEEQIYFKTPEALFNPSVLIEKGGWGKMKAFERQYLMCGYVRGYYQKMLCEDMLDVLYEYLQPNGIND
eukprot:394919_1